MNVREEREAAAIVGWLVGFAPTVWAIASVRSDGGEPLYADAAPTEYEERVKRLAELMGVDL